MRSRFHVDVLREYAIAGLIELNRLWDQLAAKVHELDDVAVEPNINSTLIMGNLAELQGDS